MNDDVISRQAAIEATWEEPTYTDPINVLTEVRDRIEALPSAQPQPHWTLMKENPPEEEGRYLVWMPLAPPKRRVTIAEYCNGYWNIKTPVLAWMPLPQFDREQEVDAQITVENINLKEMMK